MGKKLRMLSGGVMGAALQYLYDPTSGRSRRARLRDQAMARMRDVTRTMGRKIRYQRGRLRGVAHEMSTDWKSDDHDDGVADLQELHNAGTSRYQ
jgi:gas vesicle protein